MSAHSPMRRTAIFALLLLAMSAAMAASTAKPSQARRKAAGMSHAGTARSKAAVKASISSKPAKAGTSPRTKTSLNARRKTATRPSARIVAGRRSRMRMAGRASLRQARYTPAARWSRTRIEADTASSGFAAGAGLDTGRDFETAGNPVESVDRRAGADKFSGIAGGSAASISDATAAKTIRAASDAPEPKAAEAEHVDQIALLHLNGIGVVAPLRGSLASLERQNDRVEADGLERILDEDDLSSRIAHKLLVPLPASAALIVNPNLIETHRYCRPWTAHFLADLARAHEVEFHTPLQVSSAVRTVEYQKRLMRTNGNAADAEGDVVSPHLTGATVDIAKAGLTRKEMVWMRRQLLGLQDAGKLDVEEEFAQACFHITVYKSYDEVPQRKTMTPARAARRKVAQPESQEQLQQLPTALATDVIGAQGR